MSPKFWQAFILLASFWLCLGQQQEPKQLRPFSEFLQSVRNANYIDFSSTTIENEKAFIEMKNHVLSMYGGVKSPNGVQSYYSDGGHTNCLPYAEQPTFHVLRDVLSKEEMTSPTDAEIDAAFATLNDNTSKGQDAEEPLDANLFRPTTQKDIFGNIMHCSNDTVPHPRLTIESMAGYGTLARLFAKGSFNPTSPNTNTNSSGFQRRDVIREPGGYKSLHDAVEESHPRGFIGAATHLNIWQPAAMFSLSQMWVSTASPVQTVEAGWIVGGPGDRAGTRQTYPFVYFTADGYVSTGCYNYGMCAGFVRRLYGGYSMDFNTPIADISSRGGHQYEMHLSWVLISRKWSLFYHTTSTMRRFLIGWYPVTLFGITPGRLGNKAERISFGGEVHEENPPYEHYGVMGSGQKVTAPGNFGLSYRQVAYQRGLKRKIDRVDNSAEAWEPAAIRESIDKTAEHCFNRYMHPVAAISVTGRSRRTVEAIALRGVKKAPPLAA